MPELATGETSLETLVLSNPTLNPVTTADGDGYLDKLYAEWFARAGLQAELVAIPAARGLENANAGLLDGDAARITLNRDLYRNLHQIPEPVIEVIFAGLHLDPDIHVSTVADFEKYRVGYVRGWRIAENMFNGDDKAVAVRKAELLLDMLASDHIDIAFATVAPAKTIGQEKAMNPLIVTDFRVPHNLHLWLHERHIDKVPKLTSILKVMKIDGSYDEIMAEYNALNQ